MGHQVARDRLGARALRRWVSGEEPATASPRGRVMRAPNADLLLDGTINFPKSYSIAALIDPEIAEAFEQLQDRLRDRIIQLWRRELNARRGAGGCIRERIARLEVVELRHRRSRSLDPHIHRHLWLSVKVQGEDGKWSNLDSRVAMKLHTVVNAEGELAARTDPEWVAALAARGYTLGPHGEITELTPAVRPFSRRSNQIDANRAALLAAWQDEHPGLHPGPEDLHHIDERAWAHGRPNKPAPVDEPSWEAKVREEIAAIDPLLLEHRERVEPSPVPLAQLDRDSLAAAAVVDADKRSVCSSGRFSPWDIRAGAIRALASSGFVAERGLLDELIDDVCERATGHVIDLLPDEEDKPAHIKALMAEATVILKLRVAALYAELAEPGAVPTTGAIDDLAHAVVPDKQLDPDQLAAAAALAGSDGLVCVTGPAGAGKTAILQVALSALAAQHRRLLVVTPTKKAAAVVAHHTKAEATSLHGLLHDHGYRWQHDHHDAQQWTRLRVGDLDPATHTTYRGPRRYAMQGGDRVVVDEAGMVDLHTAAALAELAQEVGFGIAVVGDPRQAAPVGHAGAMALVAQSADRAVELVSTHRFTNPAYAQLTLRLRDVTTPEEAMVLASDLSAAGHIQRVATLEDANRIMVDAWLDHAAHGQRLALVTSSNDAAHALNEAIQQRRIDTGQIHSHRVTLGRHGQRLLEGDIIQTRRNDTATGVQNRATWRIRRIGRDLMEVESVTDTTDRRRIPLEYVGEHIHLAYASTVHGIQGETTDAAMVGPGVDAAGLYVGLTRGRIHNTALCVAASPEDAVRQVADSMTRAQTELTMKDSRAAASRELSRAARSPALPPPVAVMQPAAGTVELQR
ncbi:MULTISPECIES: AAA family ATPase [Microbacterium]|uniref:AAA family ATPase n=1 Tax=Microbacterium TaxID=33882 RepID=UPI001CB7158B|nr:MULTISPECIES: AAA family ATPase [Microbacterium]